jgi:NTE family protein
MKRNGIHLALGGGAVLGAAHVGVLRALEEAHIPVAAISGTSAGAIVAACYAFGVPLDRIEAVARDLGWFSISALPESALGLASNKGLGRLLMGLIGDMKIEDAQIPLYIVATEIHTAQRKVFTEGSVIDAVRASAAIPLFFSPVMVNGTLYADGGLIENVPVSVFADEDRTVTVAVDLAKQGRTFTPRTMQDMVDLCVYLFGQHRDSVLKRASTILIEPDTTNTSGADFKEVSKLIACGHAAAQERIPTIHTALRTLERRSLVSRLHELFSWKR